MRQGINPYAPPAYNGIGQTGVPQGYRDGAYDYVFNISLTANQFVSTQESIHADSDFHWRAIVVNRATGEFSVRFSDSDWYYLSSGEIYSSNLQGDPASPYPVWPEIVIPAAGRIGVDIRDQSADDNVIQLIFRGVKRYVV